MTDLKSIHKLSKITDYFVAVLSSILTAIFISMIIYVLLLNKFEGDNILSFLKRGFPSRELYSVSVIPICTTITGVLCILFFSDKKISCAFCLGDALLKTMAAAFLCFYLNFLVLKLLFAFCLLFFLASLFHLFVCLRYFKILKKLF